MNKAQIKKYVSKVCVESRDASQLARKLKSSDRNKVLNTIIKNLRNNAHQIIKKNTLNLKIMTLVKNYPWLLCRGVILE